MNNLNTFAFLQNINGPEILLIFLVVLLLFGAKRLPELFKSFGKSIREFKKATSEIEDDIRTAMDDDSTKSESKPKTEELKTKEPKTEESKTFESTQETKDDAEPAEKKKPEGVTSDKA